MSQPALAASAPAPLLRRAFDWWIAQVKHALPPTIFFFVGFNLILWTKRLILEEHGVEFSGFLTATLAALLVGKAVLFVDTGLVDGAVPCLRHDTRAQYAHRRRRTLSPILPMALVRGQAYPPSAHSPAHAAQPPDRGEPDRGLQRTGLARAC